MHDDRIQCARCGIVFPRPHHTGRRPIYCTRTCRQRAYEARRRAAYNHHLHTPNPPPSTKPTNYLYEAGRRARIRHALRPDQPPNLHRRRQTLCGTHVWTTCQPRFGHPYPYPAHDCRTCTAIAARYPLLQPLDPSPDLAQLKHALLTHKATYAHHHDDLDALHHTIDHLYNLALGRDPDPPCQPTHQATAA